MRTNRKSVISTLNVRTLKSFPHKVKDRNKFIKKIITKLITPRMIKTIEDAEMKVNKCQTNHKTTSLTTIL